MVVSYLNGYVASSWHKLTMRNPRVQTFTGEEIQPQDTVTTMLESSITGMVDYVESNLDTLAHTSWLFEVKDELDIQLLPKRMGLDSDKV